ncbi:MAG: hypothetical protein H0W62_11000 [Chitinophagales bacterium]|nr:hypothetical protein [Chitinophagales bacterium]
MVAMTAIISTALVACSSGNNSKTLSSEQATIDQADLYYCLMHPDETSAKPETCPVCGMDMIKDHDGIREHLLVSLSHVK